MPPLDEGGFEMCNISCNECRRKIFSESVTLVTIGGVDTLVIGIPEQTFTNCQRGCFVIVQNIPTTTPITAPVAIQIGDDTTTYYPVVNRCGVDITATQLRTRRRYPFRVSTNATGGVFRVTKNLSCTPSNNLLTIPTGG